MTILLTLSRPKTLPRKTRKALPETRLERQAPLPPINAAAAEEAARDVHCATAAVDGIAAADAEEETTEAVIVNANQAARPTPRTSQDAVRHPMNHAPPGRQTSRRTSGVPGESHCCGIPVSMWNGFVRCSSRFWRIWKM